MALAHPGGTPWRSAEALTSWLVQDDFGVDQDDVYEVVAAWNEHSEDVESYVALQEESGLDTEGLRDAVRQWRQHKDDYLQYETLRRDTGMDGEGMRKVSFMIDGSRVLEGVPSQQQVWLQNGRTDSREDAGWGQGSVHGGCQLNTMQQGAEAVILAVGLLAGSDAKIMMDPELGRVWLSYCLLSEQVLTSWQTHGAKLEAVRAEFQTDPQHIRDVLRVWQLQGDKINAFLESEGVQENGGTGRLPAAHGSHTANGVFMISAVHPGFVLHLECCQGCINNPLTMCQEFGCHARHHGKP